MAAIAYLHDQSEESTLPDCNRKSMPDVCHHQANPVTTSMDTSSGFVNTKKDPSSTPTRSCLGDIKIKSSIKMTISTTKGKKKVSWDRIHTREFNSVVGDHPMCQDGLPVSLGWHYDDNSCCTKNLNLILEHKTESVNKIQSSSRHQQIQLRERRQSYTFPRRLSYEERRARLVTVSNLTLDQIKNEEIDLVLRTWKESWDSRDTGQLSNNLMMMPLHNDRDFLPSTDENLMELEDIHVDNEIDVIDEDLGNITNFDWIDYETRDDPNGNPAMRN